MAQTATLTFRNTGTPEEPRWDASLTGADDLTDDRARQGLLPGAAIAYKNSIERKVFVWNRTAQDKIALDVVVESSGA